MKAAGRRCRRRHPVLISASFALSLENQIARKPTCAARLDLVPGAGKAQPRASPIVRALGRPFKNWRAEHVSQRPGRVVRDIGGEAKLAARTQDTPDRRDVHVLHEAALPVSPLRPRIWIEKVDARKRCRREPGEDVGRIAMMEPDIRCAACGYRGKCLCHAVDEGLDPNEADLRIGLCLGDHVLPAAEADLQPNLLDRIGKQRVESFWMRREIEGELGEQSVEQRRARRSQSVALAPPKDGARLPRLSFSAPHAAARPRDRSSPRKSHRPFPRRDQNVRRRRSGDRSDGRA